jgi:hypothetical protein
MKSLVFPMKSLGRCLFVLLSLLGACLPAYAHVGSKDVFEEVAAGPYKLYVTIRPPTVIPGVAGVEVRAIGAPVQAVDITPMPMTGEASTHPPTPDKMKPSAVDKAFFTGSIWMMEAGSWQVRFVVTGDAGVRTVSIPVPASSLSILKMSKGLTLLLALLGILLVCGMAGIVGAAMGEAQLEPGLTPGPSLRRRGLVAMFVSLAVMLAILWGGDHWWNVEAAVYASGLYRPPVVHATLQGNVLDIKVQSAKAGEVFITRLNNDFILDHGKVMHLYVVREPQLDAVYHLHPDFVGSGDFRLKLPNMPPGQYKLYGDVVHQNGFPETLVATITIPPGMQGRPLAADDATGAPAPLSSGLLGATYKLPDGYTMVWDKPASLTVNTAYAFHFELLAPDGKPAAHMRTYLGMAGHAAFLKTDGTVFAHVHPEGSAAMAAMMLANNQGSTPVSEMSGMAMGGGAMPDADLTSNAVEFPYGFPSPGRYRIFVQMKHDSTVETGTFDALVK